MTPGNDMEKLNSQEASFNLEEYGRFRPLEGSTILEVQDYCDGQFEEYNSENKFKEFYTKLVENNCYDFASKILKPSEEHRDTFLVGTEVICELPRHEQFVVKLKELSSYFLYIAERLEYSNFFKAVLSYGIVKNPFNPILLFLCTKSPWAEHRTFAQQAISKIGSQENLLKLINYISADTIDPEYSGGDEHMIQEINENKQIMCKLIYKRVEELQTLNLNNAVKGPRANDDSFFSSLKEIAGVYKENFELLESRDELMGENIKLSRMLGSIQERINKETIPLRATLDYIKNCFKDFSYSKDSENRIKTYFCKKAEVDKKCFTDDYDPEEKSTLATSEIQWHARTPKELFKFVSFFMKRNAGRISDSEMKDQLKGKLFGFISNAKDTSFKKGFYEEMENEINRVVQEMNNKPSVKNERRPYLQALTIFMKHARSMEKKREETEAFERSKEAMYREIEERMQQMRNERLANKAKKEEVTDPLPVSQEEETVAEMDDTIYGTAKRLEKAIEQTGTKRDSFEIISLYIQLRESGQSGRELAASYTTKVMKDFMWYNRIYGTKKEKGIISDSSKVWDADYLYSPINRSTKKAASAHKGQVPKK